MMCVMFRYATCQLPQEAVLSLSCMTVTGHSYWRPTQEWKFRMQISYKRATL